jgi:hypothetical protein
MLMRGDPLPLADARPSVCAALAWRVRAGVSVVSVFRELPIVTSRAGGDPARADERVLIIAARCRGAAG